MSRRHRGGNGRFDKRMVRSAKAGAENGALRAVFVIAGTVAFGSVVWLWNVLRNG